MKKIKRKSMKKIEIYRTNNQEYITLYSKQYFQKKKKKLLIKENREDIQFLMLNFVII